MKFERIFLEFGEIERDFFNFEKTMRVNLS